MKRSNLSTSRRNKGNNWKKPYIKERTKLKLRPNRSMNTSKILRNPNSKSKKRMKEYRISKSFMLIWLTITHWMKIIWRVVLKNSIVYLSPIKKGNRNLKLKREKNLKKKKQKKFKNNLSILITMIQNTSKSMNWRNMTMKFR